MIAATFYLECLEKLEVVSRQVKWYWRTGNFVEFAKQCDKKRNHGDPESDTHTLFMILPLQISEWSFAERILVDSIHAGSSISSNT